MKFFFFVLPIITFTSPALAVNGDIDSGKNKAQACIGCHGTNGNPSINTYPILAGQYPDYLAQALTSYKNGQRDHAIMNGIAANLNKQDIEDLSVYFGSLKGLKVKDQ